MKIAICDDLADERAALRVLINEYFAYKCADTVIEEFPSGEELIASFSADKYQLIFLDIFMNRLNGIQAAAKIRELDKAAAIIFTTTSTEFAVESYDFDAVSYLVKPLDKAKLFHALDKCCSKLSEALSYIEVISNRLTERIFIKDISHIEIYGRKSTIFCGDLNIDTNTPLKTLESELERHRFIRVSRCAIVNPAHVKMLKDDGFIMDNYTAVPFSVKEKAKIKQDFLNYCRDITRG